MAKAVREGFNKEFLDKVEPFAQKLAATNSQVRNIFSMVDRLRNKPFDEEEFLMLRPRLAYAAKRETKLQDLEPVLSKAVNTVVEVSDIKEK
ncbi:MAG: type III-A CRISPR-associated protein Csm2, partial [Desulfatibacillaceae bacterium]|nr:type III-A CRISPR-associated protein Csm2 [Desulfatibacillaceae bacterium]